MLRLAPFLLFNGKCAEAMQFYHSYFGGSLILTRLSDTPMKAQFPAEHHHKITYALSRAERSSSPRRTGQPGTPMTARQYNGDVRHW